jgi:hypothetical protein
MELVALFGGTDYNTAAAIHEELSHLLCALTKVHEYITCWQTGPTNYVRLDTLLIMRIPFNFLLTIYHSDLCMTLFDSKFFLTWVQLNPLPNFPCLNLSLNAYTTLNLIIHPSSLHDHAIPIPPQAMLLLLHMPLCLPLPLLPPKQLTPLARPTSAWAVVRQVTQLMTATSMGVVRKVALQIGENS